MSSIDGSGLRRRPAGETTVALPSGAAMPILGQGSWGMGEDRREADEEAAALAAGLDLGLSLIDTAEMYGEGGAEQVVGAAIRGRRDGVFLVSKVYPHNAGRAAAVAACERSLRRLGTDRIDLYLLHWQGSAPYAETIEAFEQLRAAGKVVDWGVSNFDLDDLEDWGREDEGRTATDQVCYSLGARGIEWDLLPWCQDRGLPVMAYSPLGQGRLLDDPGLGGVARRHGVAPATVALAWLLTRQGVVAIPKSSRIDRLREHRQALDLVLDEADLAALDRAFPPPRRKLPLAIL
ncbi:MULTISPECIES: aldo/keto reductase [Inquilinus]|uniref:Diketogulonate reductase-like aldo/keto reductase n=1 Tax=Inquilinus ginsengisoli TaxID=363840 RepID=A0ABU1JP75_9PROT|nr:aldo/keto reductase [Inquilinus ginsengisoli]MDR6290428.1 diketogulonate reductase-like aldo/keto reductase [Inquilinus ginsengisoli]